MSLAPLRFSGISSFSEDFQAIVDRSYSIASLPVKALQQDQVRLLEQNAALGNLKSVVAGLADRLTALGRLGSGGSLSGSASSGEVSVIAGKGASPGAWRVDSITSVASAGISTSAAGYDSATGSAVSGTGHLQLVVGSGIHSLVLGPGENNLTALRDKINALGAGVSASLLYSGGTTPKYYLTLTATETGAKALGLRSEADNPATELLAVTSGGKNLELSINGIPLVSSSNTVDDAIEGVTLQIKEVSASPIQLSVSTNRGAIQDALQTFADSYNAAADALDGQMGEEAGSLQGSSLVREIRQQLRAISHYASGSGMNLVELGLKFDDSGHLSYDSSAIEAMGTSQLQGALEFLNADDGLASLASRLTLFSDPGLGLIQKQIAGNDDTDLRLTKQIEVLSERIASAQATLLQKLQMADALLATLDAQRNMLNASVQSLNLVLYGRQKE